MAVFFRSISIKIFGVSLGLLVIMAAAALWSANLTEQVHLQLRTLNHSLFPLAITLGDLDSAVLVQELRAEAATKPTDAAGVQRCRTTTATQSATAAALVKKAEGLRDLGARLALLERNKIKMARIEPMIAELGFQQDRLRQAMLATCDPDAGADAMQDAQHQARDVRRMTRNITDEIRSFVSEGALLVGSNQRFAMQANLVMIGSAALVGLMLAWLVSRGLTRPIVRLQAGARAVSAGKLDDAQVPVTSQDEIGDVTRAFNTMVLDLKEKDRIQETFGQFVDPRIVASLIGGGYHMSAGEKHVATLFFSDITGFTAIAERLAPSTLVDLVNAYFSEMSVPIRQNSGIIDKYIGDAIMAFWVPPFVDASTQAQLACAAALEQFARLDAFRARIPDLVGLRRDIPVIDFRIALSSGEVVVGSIGSDHARSFTVMGDAVNFASRLENVNKHYDTRLLIDDLTRDMAGDAIEAREIDRIAVSGRDQPVTVYELAAMAGELTDDRRALFDLYAAGLALYREGRWQDAAEAFRSALSRAPQDGPSRTMLDRVERFAAAPPAEWNGVWRFTSK
jgi:class 3 adenylate cyclase